MLCTRIKDRLDHRHAASVHPRAVWTYYPRTGKESISPQTTFASSNSAKTLYRLNSIPSRDSHGGRARAVVTLDSKNLVIMGSKVQANLAPGVEVSASVDRAAGALAAADGPVLLEGTGALDGGGVGAGAGVDVVDGAVDVDLSLLGGARGGVVGSKVLDDVVLDQGVAGPAVDCEVAVAVGLVGAGVLDSSGTASAHVVAASANNILPSSTGVPTLAANKVALVAAP